jgi:hypothetical protein
VELPIAHVVRAAGKNPRAQRPLIWRADGGELEEGEIIIEAALGHRPGIALELAMQTGRTGRERGPRARFLHPAFQFALASHPVALPTCTSSSLAGGAVVRLSSAPTFLLFSLSPPLSSSTSPSSIPSVLRFRPFFSHSFILVSRPAPLQATAQLLASANQRRSLDTGPESPFATTTTAVPSIPLHLHPRSYPADQLLRLPQNPQEHHRHHARHTPP